GGVLQEQGVLAPGENMLGARPGGGTWRRRGTSCAAPIVTGVAALLMSLQRKRGAAPSAAAVRQAILESAIPCDPAEVAEPARCLRGKLNVPGAVAALTGRAVASSGHASTASPSRVVPGRPGSLVYALGSIGHDFGTEARRDTFQQLM